MKKNLAIFLIAIVVAILLVSAFYEYERKNQIIETSTIELNSENKKEEVVEVSSSGEVDFSGDVDSSGEIVLSGENEEIKNTSNTNNANSNNDTKKLTSNTPYYIKINNSQNVVTIYTKDENGKYTVPFKTMVCSVGTATPSAGKSYKVTSYKNRWNGLQGNVYGQYATQIVGNILFHSVPYTAKNNATLEYWEYDKLGTSASLGCVRLTVEDAKWIYDNISSGTIVEFYEDENPGPLGKPTAQKISDNEALRTWDPTDPDERNPWNGGSGITENNNTISPKADTPKVEEVPVTSDEQEDATEENDDLSGDFQPEESEEELEEDFNSYEIGEYENDYDDDWIGSGVWYET